MYYQINLKSTNMRKLIYIIGLLLFTTVSYSQNIEEEKVIFDDLRLPLEPLGDNVAGYFYTVATPYPENNNNLKEHAQAKYDEELKNYPKTVEESEVKYQEALVQYEKDVVAARENFQIESDQYNKLSVVERLALADNKPVLRLPNKPNYYKPTEPRYYEPDLSNSIVFNPEVLASTYLKLDGFEQNTSSENVVKGDVIFYNFEYTEPEQKVEEKSVYNTKTKTTDKVKTYYYITSTKRPTSLKLQYNDKTLYDGIFESTGEFKSLRTDSRPSIINIEKKSIEDILLDINEFVNNKYGFSKISRTIDVRYVKNKSGDYDDLEEAKDFAIAGFKNFNGLTANEDLAKAIEIWEIVMEESNPEDRKARIDKKVTKAVLLNLTEAYLYTGKIDKVTNYIEKLENLSPNYSEKELIKAFKSILEDKSKRMAANGM